MLIIAPQGKGNGPAGLDPTARARNRRKDTVKIRQNTSALFSFHNLKCYLEPGSIKAETERSFVCAVMPLEVVLQQSLKLILVIDVATG